MPRAMDKNQNKWDYIKVKSFCIVKETRTYMSSPQNAKKQTKTLKWGENKHYSEKDQQMTNKHLKKSAHYQLSLRKSK